MQVAMPRPTGLWSLLQYVRPALLTTAPLEYLHCDDGEAGQCHEGSCEWEIVKAMLGDIPVFGCFGLAEKKYGWLVVMRMGHFRAPFNSHLTYLKMIGERYGSFACTRNLPSGICGNFQTPYSMANGS